jgi:hypothetical protein
MMSSSSDEDEEQQSSIRCSNDGSRLGGMMVLPGTGLVDSRLQLRVTLTSEDALPHDHREMTCSNDDDDLDAAYDVLDEVEVDERL